MNINYQLPREQRLPATLLDQDGRQLSRGEAFLHADKDTGAFFQTSLELRDDELGNAVFVKFSEGVPIPISYIEPCMEHGDSHLSFSFHL